MKKHKIPNTINLLFPVQATLYWTIAEAFWQYVAVKLTIPMLIYNRVWILKEFGT